MVELMYIKFSNPAALFLEISCGKKQTNRQINTKTPLRTLPRRLPSTSNR